MKRTELTDIFTSRDQIHRYLVDLVQRLMDAIVPTTIGTHCIVHDQVTGKMASVSNMPKAEIVLCLRAILAELEEALEPTKPSEPA